MQEDTFLYFTCIVHDTVAFTAENGEMKMLARKMNSRQKIFEYSSPKQMSELNLTDFLSKLELFN